MFLQPIRFETIVLFFRKLESEKSRFEHSCHLNIAYGSSSCREKLDIYGDDLKADSPLAVYVHGGYWQLQEMNKWTSAFAVGPLVKNEVRVIVIGHELCPKVSLEQAVAQVKEAFKWIAKYVYDHSIKSVSIVGHSAGGHLIACILNQNFINSIATDVRIFAYFVSGVYDLTELQHLKVANDNNILSLSDANVRSLSPQYFNYDHLQNRDIKFYVYAAEHESEKFKQQSKDFAEIPLKDLSSVTFEIINGVDHFDIVEKLSESDYEMTKLIVNNATEP